jgi:predicted aspartyl protease
MIRLEYVDGDPMILIKITNPSNGNERETYAYVDTGSDSIALPRDLWMDLDLGFRDRLPVSTVIGTSTTWVSLAEVEFLGDVHRDVPVFYQEEGDALVGRSIIDHYAVAFDGINQILRVEK